MVPPAVIDQHRHSLAAVSGYQIQSGRVAGWDLRCSATCHLSAYLRKHTGNESPAFVLVQTGKSRKLSLQISGIGLSGAAFSGKNVAELSSSV